VDLLARLDEITHDLGNLAVPFDDWQVIYRQILQVERAIRGERQLLDDEAPGTVGGAPRRPPPPARHGAKGFTS
jgi:hypothetical protein